MTQITVSWSASEKLRKQEFIKTGKRSSDNRSFQLDLTELIQAQRKPIIAFLGLNRCYLSTQVANEFRASMPSHMKTRLLTFDSQPTVDDVVDYVVSEKVVRDAVAVCEAEINAEKKAEQERKQALYNKLGPELESLVEQGELAALEAFRFLKKGIANFKPSGNRASLYKLLSDGIKDLRKGKREADKSAWIAAHGSDYLRRVSAGGYDAQRLYVTERSAMEAPDFIVDFDEKAEWRDRTCPSLEALDAESEAEKLGIGKPVMVVWLVKPAVNSVGDEDDWYDGFEPCEAVVIQDYLGQLYDLVQVL